MIGRRVVLRRPAKRDLAQAFRWFESHTGTDTAERFLSATSESFAELLTNPHLGPRAGSRSTGLEELRRWRVSRFSGFLIFYLPNPNGILVFRVLHA